MPYKLEANLEKGFVHLVYSGDVTLEERQQAKDAVFALCFEKNLHRSLVDLRGSNIQMSEADIIKFADSFKNTKIPENYRLAGIADPDNQKENILDILIATEGINIKYFLDFDSAVSWLTAV